jgi:hypothetical protein
MSWKFSGSTFQEKHVLVLLGGKSPKVPNSVVTLDWFLSGTCVKTFSNLQEFGNIEDFG